MFIRKMWPKVGYKYLRNRTGVTESRVKKA